MGIYAKDTTVTVDKSQAEIERILMRYGAAGFMRGWDQNKAFLAFQVEGRRVRFIIPMPSRDEFNRTERGRLRTSSQAVTDAWEKACRQRWRAMSLVVKAKLEAVQTGIATIEDEFMAYILLPNGQTVGEWMSPQIENAYETGAMPPMLPSGEHSARRGAGR